MTTNPITDTVQDTVTLHNLSMSQIATYKELLSHVYGSYIHISYTVDLVATILKHLPESTEASVLLGLTEEYQMLSSFQEEAWETFTTLAQGMMDGIALDPISEVSKQAYENMQEEMHTNVARLWGVVSKQLAPSLHSVVVEEMLDKIDNSNTAMQHHEVLAGEVVTLPDNILQIIHDLEAQANKTFVISN